LLYVLDPETEGHEISEAESGRAAQDIRRASLAGFMRLLGHPNLATRLASLLKFDVSTLQQEVQAVEKEWISRPGDVSSTSESFEQPVLLSDATRSPAEPNSIEVEAINIADDQFKGRRFIGGVVDITGRLVPSNVSEVLQGRTGGPTGVYQNLYFAGFDVAVLIAALSDSPPPTLLRLRVDRRHSESLLPTILGLGDGFVLAPVEALSPNTEAAPAELAQPLTP
jgi:hypothetical protein